MFMPNNLNAMIKKSGMTKREVAAANGVTPETISRQIHSKVQMTLKDVEKYAAILECTPQEILFAVDPVPIIARSMVTEDGRVERGNSNKDVGHIFSHNYYVPQKAAVLWSVEQGYSGNMREWDGAVTFVDNRPIVKQFISKSCFQNVSLCKVSGEDSYFSGDLYPEPGNLYTLHCPYEDKIQRGLSLEWATPMISVVYRPDLLDMQIVLNSVN